MKNKKNLRAQSGQLILEAILLMTLFVGVATLIKQQVGDRNIVGAMVAGPWKNVAGMMANGVWKSETEGRVLHPQGNVVTREGDTN